MTPLLKPFELIIFDLDGTLIDSKKDIALAANFVRLKMALDPISEDRIGQYVGKGVTRLLEDVFQTKDQEILQKGTVYFLEYYAEHCLDHTRLFPGVKAVLSRLQHAQLAVCTNKPLGFTQKILKGLDIASYFPWVVGGDSLPHKKPDPTGIFWLMEKARVSKEKTCLVGDSPVDGQTGKNAGVHTILLSQGFSSKESLQEAPADLLIHSFLDFC